jgi:hypothetical protein
MVVLSKTDKLFHNEETAGRAVFARWIGHPATRAIITRRLVAAETVTMPVARFLVDQIQVIRFCTRIFEVGVRYPDGTEEPNPFDPADPQGWPMTPHDRRRAIVAISDLHAIVQFTLSDLVTAGVPVAAGWDGDRANVAQVLLTPQLPWHLPAGEIADLVQPVGISTIWRDGTTVTARAGRPERAAINVDRIRRLVENDQTAPVRASAAYAGGHQRATPRASVVRREILRDLIDRFPKATVATIHQTYDNSDKTPGGFLRVQLAARLNGQSAKPSRSTLHNDLRVLAGQEPTPAAEPHST